MKTKNPGISRTLKRRRSLFVSELILILLTVLGIGRDTTMLKISAVCLILHTIFLIYLLIKDSRNKRAPSDNPLLSGMTMDFVSSLKKPVVIVGKDCVITWYNDEFIKACNAKSALYGKNISEEISHTLHAARLFRENAANFELILEDVVYEVSCNVVTSAGKQYCILMFDDISELTDTKNLLDSKNTLVAFIVIDNFSEAMQFMQDKS